MLVSPWQFIVAGMGAGYAVYALVYAAVSSSLRAWLDSKRLHKTFLRPVWTKVAQAASCPWCAAFWVCLAVQLTCRLNAFPGLGWRGLALSHLALTLLAAYIALATGTAQERIHPRVK